MTLPDIASLTVTERALGAADAPVVALVSGGADSVAMLRLLAGGLLGEGPLSVLHVNHQLRGEDADADEAFVVSLADSLGIACTAVRVDVGALAADEGLNLEDAGREVRYRLAEEALDGACVAAGVSPEDGRIAVAHTLDDRIETLLGRLADGSGAGALASIRHRRGRIVRPLLDARRDLVRDHLRELGQDWREDASNSDTARRRALIRAEILPALERLNPAFRENMRRTMDLLADEDELLGGMAYAFARDFGDVDFRVRVSFDAAMLKTLSRPMARRTLREGITRAFPQARRLDAVHVEALVDGLADERFARDLSFGLRAEVAYGTLEVRRADETRALVEPTLFGIPGVAELGDLGRIVAREAGPDERGRDADSVVIDRDTIGAELLVDSVRTGDRMQVLGMSEGTRTLADMLVDAKVPRRERLAVPVVRNGADIVWLAGVRMSERHKVTDGTVRAVRLTWERGL